MPDDVSVSGFGPPRGKAASYLWHSITRLEILSDNVITSKAQACLLLKQYGPALPTIQREILSRWCGGFAS